MQVRIYSTHTHNPKKHTQTCVTSMQVINHRTKNKEGLSLASKTILKWKRQNQKQNRETYSTHRSRLTRKWTNNITVTIKKSTSSNYRKIIKWHITRRIYFWSTPKCTMLTVRHRSIRVRNEKYMRKVRDCRAGCSSCEILALPCHSVSVGPI